MAHEPTGRPGAGPEPLRPAGYPVLAIVGPTASGKSALGLFLAETFDGEIVNYDSIQVYRDFDIGTAKPSPAERQRVPHHLLDILDPREPFNAGAYQRRARAVLEELRGRGRRPVLVGGTGLYLRAVLEGLFDGPERSEYWRDRLRTVAAAKGPEHLHRVLARLDPETAARIAPRDAPKIIRALEVRLETGRPLSAHLSAAPRHPLEGFRIISIGLDPPRADLHERIGARVRHMFEAGLIEEVRRLIDRGIPPEAPAFRAIGYRQALQHLAGVIGREEAMNSVERETRRYAKRQVTWFRRQHTVTWFDGFGDDDRVRERIRPFVRQALEAG